MNLAYALYMAEAECQFPEQRAKAIADCISDFRAIKARGDNPNKYINRVLSFHGLKEYMLTNSEIKQITAAVDALKC